MEKTPFNVGMICVICALVVSAYINYRLGDRIYEETITVTIDDIIFIGGEDNEYQIKFGDGSWKMVGTTGTPYDIVKSLKIGHNYRLTIGKTHFSENQGFWVIFGAEEIEK